MKFEDFDLTTLRKLIDNLREYHNIPNYHKMKKPELVAALNHKFHIHNGLIYLNDSIKREYEDEYGQIFENYKEKIQDKNYPMRLKQASAMREAKSEYKKNPSKRELKSYNL